MAVSTPCPKREDLERVLLGLLPEPQAEQLEQHLVECEQCVATLAELGAGDTLVEAMRAGPAAAAELAVHADLAKRVTERWVAPRGPRSDATPAGSAIDEPTSELGPRRTVAAGSLDEEIDFLAPALADDELGRLGDYRVLRVLGTGGMGVVFEAQDTQLERHVALKVMKPGIAASAAARKRFLREAKAAAAVDHDHIVPVYQVGEDRGVPFIAMPLLHGETLADRLGRLQQSLSAAASAAGPAAAHGGPVGKVSASLPIAELLRVGRGIAAGLAAAHQRRLIHRDIKPSNIWLEADTGRAKILDFGLARANDAGEQLTQAGATLGTPAYMSPEQASGNDVDARSDLFSLGCVLYHAATGRRPFLGRDALSTLLAVTTVTPPAPRELNPALPGDINDLIEQLLAKDPAARPQTARDVMERLQEVERRQASGEGSGFGVQGSGEQVAQPPSAVVVSALLPLPLGEGRGEGGLHHSPVDGPLDDRSPHRVPASGWREGNHHAERDVYGSAPGVATLLPLPPHRRRGLIMLASAAAAAALLAGIVITIKDEKGRTVAQVETNGQAEVSGLAPGHTATFSAAADSEDSKTQDLSPKTFTANPKSWYGWPADAPAPAIAPFNAAQAKKHQQEWADYLKVPVEHTNSIGMKFVLIPPGEFMMGSTEEEIEEALKVVDPNNKHWQECIKSEAPQHQVILTRPFYLAVHETTQEEYEAVMGQNPSYFASTSSDAKVRQQVANLNTENHPVEMVSWNDAAEFCAKLSKQEELKPFYFRVDETVTPLKGTGYRLPAEGEWEFACRAGTTTKFWNGDESPAGWFSGNSGARTHEVEELPSNPFGLFDVYGNVWEWVEDSWQPTFHEQFSDVGAIGPKQPVSAGSPRVERSGYWYANGSLCRSAHRYADLPAVRTNGVGFRVALVVEAVRHELTAAKPTDTVTGSATSKSTGPPPAADPNAEVFKWVNEIGGKQLFSLNGPSITVKSPGEVKDAIPDGFGAPGLGTFWTVYLPQHVTEADLKRFRSVTKPLRLMLGGTDVTDGALTALADLPNLVDLYFFEQANISRAGLDNLGTLPNLYGLQLLGTSCSDADLSSLSRFPKLWTATLEPHHLTARGAEALSALPDLCKLMVYGSLKREEAQHLAALSKLQILELHQVNDDCIDYLEDLSELRDFVVGGSGLTDDGFAKVPKILPRLEGLLIKNSPVTDAGLKHFQTSQLARLRVEGTRITAAGVAELQAALPKCHIDWTPTLPPPSGDPNRDAAEWVLAMGGKVAVAPQVAGDTIGGIESVSKLPAPPYRLVGVLLRGPFIRDDDLGRFSNVAALETIQIADAKITGAALAHLRGLANLRSVDFNISPVGDEGTAWLKELPKLESLTLASAGLTSAALEQVGALRRLGSLRLDYNPGITDEGLAHLLPLHALRHLNLAGTSVSDAGAEQLRELKQLTELSVGSTCITDDGLASLASLKRLKRLEIYDNPITDAGMPEIAKLTGLERLIMTRTRVGDDGLEKLKELTKLQELYLERTELTDDGLKHLHGLTNLKLLDVSHTHVTAAGIAELQAALPNCKVIHDPPSAAAE